MRRFGAIGLLLICWLATLHSEQIQLSYSQALRRSALLLRTEIDEQALQRMRSEELARLWQEAERLRQIFETSFGEASASLEISQQELRQARIDYARLSDLSKQLRTLLSERESLERSQRLRSFLMGIAAGSAVTTIVVLVGHALLSR
jgi:hypothetical protein